MPLKYPKPFSSTMSTDVQLIGVKAAEESNVNREPQKTSRKRQRTTDEINWDPIFVKRECAVTGNKVWAWGKKPDDVSCAVM
jgi:hypothetical protein